LASAEGGRELLFHPFLFLLRYGEAMTMMVPKALCGSHAVAKRWAVELAKAVVESDSDLRRASGPLEAADDRVCMLYEGQETQGHAPIRLYAVFAAMARYERTFRENGAKRENLLREALVTPWALACLLTPDGGRVASRLPNWSHEVLAAVARHWQELSSLRFGVTPFARGVTSLSGQLTTVQSALLAAGVAERAFPPHGVPLEELQALVFETANRRLN
jgi:hypothetical protein